MAVTARKVTYKNFGKCLKITNGDATVLVTLDFGPRVIRYCRAGGRNFFYEDNDGHSASGGKEFDEFYGEGAAFRMRGGHRIWCSPEAMPQTYYPDNTPVSLIKKDGGYWFTADPQKENGIRISLFVSMAETGTDVEIISKIENTGTEQKTYAVWAISVMCGGGLEVFKQNTNNTGLLHNRHITLWPYADMTDNRLYLGKKYISLKQKKNAKGPLKIGTDNAAAFSAYFSGGDLFVKKFAYFPDETYPDCDCVFETYTNRSILEIESLSPLRTVAPGGFTEHRESWSIVKGVKCPGAKDESAFDRVFGV